jgi:hypothetical protein
MPITHINLQSDEQSAPALCAQIAQLLVLVENLKSEVIRLRRHRFGASAERLDPAIAPQLPLSGCEQPAVSSLADLHPLPASDYLSPR